MWAGPRGGAITLQEASESIPKTMTARDNFTRAVELKHGTEVDPVTCLHQHNSSSSRLLYMWICQVCRYSLQCACVVQSKEYKLIIVKLYLTYFFFQVKNKPHDGQNSLSLFSSWGMILITFILTIYCNDITLGKKYIYYCYYYMRGHNIEG